MSSAGYSGTPLGKKLGIKPGHRVVLVSPSPGWEIPDLPQGCTVTVRLASDGDLNVAFFRSLDELRATAPDLAATLAPASALWIAWPRKAGGHQSDISENDLRELLLPLGVVDVKVAALDTDWSALKFVWRKENRH